MTENLQYDILLTTRNLAHTDIAKDGQDEPLMQYD
jgi:hypothetical protein